MSAVYQRRPAAGEGHGAQPQAMGGDKACIDHSQVHMMTRVILRNVGSSDMPGEMENGGLN